MARLLEFMKQEYFLQHNHFCLPIQPKNIYLSGVTAIYPDDC